MGARPSGQCRVIITYLILKFPTLPPTTYLSVNIVHRSLIMCISTFLIKHFLFLCMVEFVRVCPCFFLCSIFNPIDIDDHFDYGIIVECLCAPVTVKPCLLKIKFIYKLICKYVLWEMTYRKQKSFLNLFQNVSVAHKPDKMWDTLH